LLLLGTGQRAAGRALLRRCLHKATKGKYWRERARALRGLGDTAWDDDDLPATIAYYRRAIRVAEKHDLDDELWSARANLAGALHQSGRVHEAIAALEAAEPFFALDPEGNRFTAFLARCYRDVGMHDKADAFWERARTQALAVGDGDTIVCASAELANSLARKQGYAAGDAALRRSLSTSNRRSRIRVCRAGVELAIAYREFETGNQWLGLLTKAAEKYGPSEDVVDAYMAFGDALWQDKEHRQVGAQAFIFGQVHGWEVSGDALVDAGIHLLRKLLELDASERREIHQEMDQWLTTSKQEKTTRDGLRFVFWPFRVADWVGETKGVAQAIVQCRALAAIDQEFKRT
jgi:tetratricopeptide (TPR) repeat protein